MMMRMNDDDEIFAPPSAAPEEPAPDSDASGAASAPSPAPARRSALVRWGRRAAIGGALLWFFWYPMDSRELFLAMPEETLAAVCLDGLSSEELAFVEHPLFRDAVSALGLDPDHVAKNNDGLYWTLFFLSGRHSVAGVVPAEGECGGLGYYLAGASYVGWKARAMECLWRIRYVPALGPLKKTARGTRYMEFPDARELADRDIVLGMDIVDGVLVVALANDPDRVIELARRIRDKDNVSLARCFREAPAPASLDVPLRHRVWLAREALPGVAGLVADLPSFREPGLRIDVESRDPSFRSQHLAPLSSGALPANLSAPLDSAILVAACDAGSFARPLAEALGPGRPAAAGSPAGAWVAARPYLGDLTPLLLVPSVCASLPRDSSRPFASWWDRAFADLRSRAGSLGLVCGTRSDGTRLLRARALERFGETPESSRVFLRPTADRIELGSHAGLWDRQIRDGAAQGRETVGSLVESWRRESGLVAGLRLDADRFGAQFRHFGTAGLLGLALRTGMLRLEPEEWELADVVCEAAEAARAFGRIDVSVTHPEPDALRVRIRASGR